MAGGGAATFTSLPLSLFVVTDDDDDDDEVGYAFVTAPL